MSGAGASPIWKVITSTNRAVIVKEESPMKLNVMHSSTGGNKVEHYMAPAVAKSPAIQAAQLKGINQVMGVASATATMAMVEPSEMTAIESFATCPASFKGAIAAARSGGCILIKMNFDPKFATSANKGVPKDKTEAGDKIMTADDQRKARELFEGLRNNDKAWQTLGQVCIADYIVGNADRIDLEGGKVQNFGNLIFSKNAQGQITHALGYDAVNPFAGIQKNMYGSDIDDWVMNYGEVIRDKRTFHKQATAIIADINAKRMLPLKLKPFSAREATALGTGLVAGWDDQAKAIRSRSAGGGGIPSGLMARAVWLGWVR